MTERSYRRLTRWALCGLAVQLLALPTIVALPLIREPEGWALPVYVVLAVQLLAAWGHVQADVAINPRLDDDGRRRWRIALACLPGGLALYWHREVRPRRRISAF